MPRRRLDAALGRGAARAGRDEGVGCRRWQVVLVAVVLVVVVLGLELAYLVLTMPR